MVLYEVDRADYRLSRIYYPIHVLAIGYALNSLGAAHEDVNFVFVAQYMFD